MIKLTFSVRPGTLIYNDMLLMMYSSEYTSWHVFLRLAVLASSAAESQLT